MDGIGLYPAPPSRSPLSARAFGPQLLLGELIGRGGMSRVYRGWVRGTGHEVAVKILRDDLASSPDAVQRFIRERDLLAAVASRHVVRVHDLVVHGDELGIVMDLVAGGHLRRAFTFPCPPATAAELVTQIADGLAAVHATGVIHRDLKPENVLVDGDGDGGVCLRLTDFGISRLMDAALTQTTVTGTPGYLAPEVAAGMRPTAAADVYALGVVLYELSTGRGPFVADNPLVLILAHTRQQAPRPIGMPDALWSLLAAMLAKDPAARPTAAAVANALRALTPALHGLPPCEPPEPEPIPDAVPDVPPAPSVGPPSPSVGPQEYAGQAPGEGARFDGVQIMAPAGTGQPGRPLTSELPLRRSVHHPPDGPNRSGGLGGRLALVPVWARLAAVAAGLLLVMSAAVGIRQSLSSDGGTLSTDVDDPIVTSTTSAPAAPAPSTPTSKPTTSALAGPRTITFDPSTPPSSATESSPKGGATPTSPTPSQAPGVPTLVRSVPSPGEEHSSDRHVILTVRDLSAGTGSITSVVVTYDEGREPVRLTTPPAASYDLTIDGLENGRKYTFTATVCNSAKLCSTSGPLEFTPYGAPEVPRPRAGLDAGKVTVTWEAVERNHNPGETRCTIAVTGTPADPGLPGPQDASPDGGRLTFTGKAGTDYVATLSCSTGGVSDGSASSKPLQVPTPPSPSTSPPPPSNAMIGRLS